jgi:16S rRNA pseudouridine516 synthase
MGKERLDKVLVHMGLGSRREVKELLKQGRVLVDNVAVRDGALHIDPAAQTIHCDGASVHYQRHFYYLLHKPGGVLTATEDRRQPTVMDLLPPELLHPDLFPVGRLDKDTEGLLLITTDGELGHRLLSPRWHVEKRYLALLDRELDPNDPVAFAAGILLEDGYQSMPAHLEIVAPKQGLVTIREGKYHQIKRMFAARGNHVHYLKRLAMGPLALGDLPLGDVRLLTPSEVSLLRTAVGLVG